MKILLIYHQKPRAQRKAISSHLESFGKFYDNVHYWNIAFGIPSVIKSCDFDCILFHFTFFIQNINNPFTDKDLDNWKIFSSLKAYKAAIIQDEYINTITICKFLKMAGVQEIFSCLPESLFQEVYPREKTGVQRYHRVLTGYIDEQMIQMFENRTKKHKSRSVDIAYRARKMPYNLGIFGTYKWRLTEIFNKKIKNSPLRIDLSNDPNDFIFGDNWYDFLGNTRTTLGCEGGSSLHDPDGKIKKRVTQYMLDNPAASFSEVEKHCFKGLDEKFPYYALSPRHLEAAVSKTCQVLVEGEYNGILLPNIHYIPVKKDWSNVEIVIDKISDLEYCEQIAEKAYQDLVLTEKYTYKEFVNFIVNRLKEQVIVPKKRKNNHFALTLLKYQIKFPLLFHPISFAKRILIEWVKRLIWFLGIDKYNWFKKLELKLLGSSAVR